jgi:single-stranded-DNA-specific exonuclease
LRTVTKTWQLLPHDEVAIAALARALGVAPLVAQLLLNRKLGAPDAAGAFLQAALTGLREPDLLPGVPEAAERILGAIKKQQRICVYGDYDVDGVSGTAILLSVLRLMNATYEFHVPHRLEDGYGLNIEALRRLKAAGTDVVVTVDCGIASVAEAEEAKKLGLELIVTDHHEPKAELPAALLVHPRLATGNYPFGGLCGAGVALKLAWSLCKRHCGGDKVSAPFREVLLDAVALASLGTVADVVPLHDENRILVRHGLARLRNSPNVGIKALLESAKLNEKPALASYDIGYTLAPRLNAAGRLGSARLAVELLTTQSPQRAAELARFLEQQNYERQLAEKKIYTEAKAMAEEQSNAGAPAFVLASASWHAGLIGIVAGRLMEAYARPVLMIATSKDGTLAAGSGRSIPGFRLHEALAACGEDLLSHGGHATAAGFKLQPGRLPAFQERFLALAGSHFAAAPPVPKLVIDAEVPLAALTLGVAESLNHLEPYGAGNPQPLLLAAELQVVGEPRRVGNGERHLSFRVRQKQREMKAIAFGMGEDVDELMSAGGQCCLVFTPKINEWQGRRSVELEVKDFQAGPRAQLA